MIGADKYQDRILAIKDMETASRISRTKNTENTLGKGTYGKVTTCNDDDTLAKKSYSLSSELIQEAIILIYLKDIPCTLRIRDFDIPKKFIIFDRWNMSLRQAITTVKFTYNQKLDIFRDILIGLGHIHSLDITHGDLKMSNILININRERNAHESGNHGEYTVSACICDVGLSSLSKYAKISRTADSYRPKKIFRSYSHDMFGLCVTMCKVFGGIPITGGKTEEELSKGRESEEIQFLIKHCNKFPNDKIKKILLSLVPNDPSKCPTAKQILNSLFGISIKKQKKLYEIYENRLSDEIILYVTNTICGFCKSYNINRDLRCIAVTLNYLNNSNFNDDNYEIYILSSLIIFSSVFGSKPIFDTNAAISSYGKEISRYKIHKYTRKLLKSTNYINHMMFSKT